MPRHATLTERTCEACHKTFQVPLARLRFRPASFCSRSCLYSGRVKSLEVRFHRLIGLTTETGCILWGGATNNGGYGMIRLGFQKRMVLASRVAWEFANGPIPDNLFVLHNCPSGDNPLCINVAHLWLGTAKDNSQDMLRKERKFVKLTAEQVLVIRERYAKGETDRKLLAKGNQVSRGLIDMIVTRKIWAHI